MLSAPLRRNVRHRRFDDLQKRLLHALARDVARDGHVLALSCDLVDLVDIDDAALRALDIVICVLDELQKDILDILADVARLGERGRVARGKGHVEDARERSGKQRLAAARGPEQKDIALFDLHAVVRLFAGEHGVDALVVVVHRHGENALRLVLPDDILIQLRLDLGGLFEFHRFLRRRRGHLCQHVAAQLHALVADEHAVRAGNEFFYFGFFLPAEGTALFVFCHKHLY